MYPKEQALEAIAYHEAGHAIAVVFFNHFLGGVSINGIPGKSLGYCIHEKTEEEINRALAGDGKEAFELVMNHIVILYCGAVAEKWYLSEVDPSKSNSDLNDEVVGKAEEDFRILVEFVWKLFKDKEKCTAAIKGVSDIASAIMDENWAAVEALAQALLKKKELNGEEARAIIKANI